MTGRVVITGLGAVGPWGAGREGLRQALADSRPTLVPLDAPGVLAERTDLHLRPGVAWAGRVGKGALEGWLPGAAARRMSPLSRFAVAAARMALADAGLDPPGPAQRSAETSAGGWERLAGEAALILSTTYGPSSVTEELEEQILGSGPEAASPFLFAESVANAPAAQVARLTGARGANLTVTAREAGALVAVARAADEVAAGRSALALGGVVDELTPLLQAVLDRFRALARSRRPGEPPVARPFDRRRAGYLTGEGAAVLALEHSEAAAARGRAPLAVVAGAGRAFDPTAPRSTWGTGQQLLSGGLRRVLERAGVEPEGVDLVVSGANGSRAGDRLEALTLQEAWGTAPLPPVVAPKGVTGELGGGQLAAALLALEGARFGPSPGFRRGDPELGLVPWGGGASTAPPRRVLVSALAPGGTAAWLILERPPAARTPGGKKP